MESPAFSAPNEQNSVGLCWQTVPRLLTKYVGAALTESVRYKCEMFEVPPLWIVNEYPALAPGLTVSGRSCEVCELPAGLCGGDGRRTDEHRGEHGPGDNGHRAPKMDR